MIRFSSSVSPAPRLPKETYSRGPLVVRGEPRHFVRLLPAHAPLQVLEPTGVERCRASELHRLRIQQQVQMGRCLEELAERVRVLPALGEEAVEVVVDGFDDLVEALAERTVPGPVVLTAAGQVRRYRLVLDLVLRARDDPRPGLAEPLDGGEQDHVVDADHVRPDPGQDARKILLGPLRAVDDRLPAFLDVVVDLVDRRLAEIRDVAVDEVLPELRHLLGRHGLGEVHRVRFESVALVDLDETRVRQEHRLVTACLDGLGDSDGIESGTEGGLGKECERLLRHGAFTPQSGRQRARVRGGPARFDSISLPDRRSIPAGESIHAGGGMRSAVRIAEGTPPGGRAR